MAAPEDLDGCNDRLCVLGVERFDPPRQPIPTQSAREVPARQPNCGVTTTISTIQVIGWFVFAHPREGFSRFLVGYPAK